MLKLFINIKSCVIFLVILLAFIAGCCTSDLSHNTAHHRVFKKDMELMHRDIDSFLGINKLSGLKEY